MQWHGFFCKFVLGMCALCCGQTLGLDTCTDGRRIVKTQAPNLVDSTDPIRDDIIKQIGLDFIENEINPDKYGLQYSKRNPNNNEEIWKCEDNHVLKFLDLYTQEEEFCAGTRAKVRLQLCTGKRVCSWK